MFKIHITWTYMYIIDFGVQAHFKITALLSLQHKDQFGFSISPESVGIYLAPAYSFWSVSGCLGPICWSDQWANREPGSQTSCLIDPRYTLQRKFLWRIPSDNLLFRTWHMLLADLRNCCSWWKWSTWQPYSGLHGGFMTHIILDSMKSSPRWRFASQNKGSRS